MWVILTKKLEGTEGELIYKFSIGFYKPDGSFETYETTYDRGWANEFCSYLNGGSLNK